MSKTYQYDVNETWDVVLYYKRSVNAQPTEPNFNNLRQENPDFTTNQLLDMFSKLKTQYIQDLDKFKSDNGGTIDSFVFFPSDEKFSENVIKFEKNNYFIEWTKSSKELINSTIIKLSKK